jgi:murein DD-endopeptidase MepM/ murein hydrolase activator NlpD
MDRALIQKNQPARGGRLRATSTARMAMWMAMRMAMPLAMPIALSGALGCAHDPANAKPTPEAPVPGEEHVVKPGETVFDIARESGLSVEEILEVNGLSSSTDVAPGDRLFLPAGRARLEQMPTPMVGERSTATTPPPLPPTGGRLLWPVDGVVLRVFSPGKGRDAPYDGLLIAAPADTPVLAAAAGRISFVGDQGSALGQVIVLEHADDLVTIYAHVEHPIVGVGDSVAAGERLAIVGTSGGQESPRLQFQVRKGRVPVDPRSLLSP